MSSLNRAGWLPVQWPGAAAVSSDFGGVLKERLLKGAILFAMLALTVLDRFGLRVVGESSIPVGMIAMYGLAAAMVFAGAAELNARAALAYLAVVCAAALSSMVNAAFLPPPFLSKMSLLFLIVLYAPLCLSFRRGTAGPELWRWTLNLYIGFAVFLAMAGIAQYFIQFVFRPPWLFDYTPLIPESLRYTAGWNTAYAVDAATGVAAYGSGEAQWVKSNGFFMREPSIFSTMMAFGLVCELSLARRKWVMVVLALGLVLSYSGSGLLCLAAALLFPLGRRTVARIVAFAVLAVAIFFFFGDALQLSYTVNRSDEFLVRNSSAYCRFIAPGVDAIGLMNSEPWASLLGHGPGSMIRIGAGCHNMSTTYGKAFIEYGLLGTLAFGVLMIGALNRSSAPLRIRVAAGLTWLLLGGNLLDSLYLLFIYVVSAMWPEGTARAVTGNGRSPGAK